MSSDEEISSVAEPQCLSTEARGVAIARLIEMAADLHLHQDWSRACVNALPGGAHISADGGPIGSFRAKGKGNYLFTAPGALTSRMHVILDATDSIVYIGAEATGADLTAVRMSGGSRNFVYIGARSHLTRVALMITGPSARLVVGEDCVLQRGIIVTNSDGHSVYDVASGVAINPDADVVIGNQVFIGSDARINKGAQIGSGSVVAARSVVQGSLPAGGYHAGFPARCRKQGIVWSRDEAIQKLPLNAEQLENVAPPKSVMQ